MNRFRTATIVMVALTALLVGAVPAAQASSGDPGYYINADGEPVFPSSITGDPALSAPQDISLSFPVAVDDSPTPTTGLISASGVAAATTLPGTRGTVFWYSAYIYNNRVYTVGNIRYSWSHMWKIKNSMDTMQGLISAACGLIPNRGAQAACAAVVTVVYAGIRTAVNGAITYKKCLSMRFPMPPLVGLVSYRLVRVTCTA